MNNDILNLAKPDVYETGITVSGIIKEDFKYFTLIKNRYLPGTIRKLKDSRMLFYKRINQENILFIYVMNKLGHFVLFKEAIFTSPCTTVMEMQIAINTSKKVHFFELQGKGEAFKKQTVFSLIKGENDSLIAYYLARKEGPLQQKELADLLFHNKGKRYAFFYLEIILHASAENTNIEVNLFSNQQQEKINLLKTPLTNGIEGFWDIIGVRPLNIDVEAEYPIALLLKAYKRVLTRL